MTITDLCQRDIVTIDADASAFTAANLMRDCHVGSLVVTTAAEPPRVVGVITDRDLAIEVMARGLDPNTLQVGKLARGALIDVPASASVRETVEAMELGGVRRVLVVQDDGGVAGIVTLDDLVANFSDEFEGLARALRSGMQRETAERKPVETARRPVFLPEGMAALE